MNTKFSIVTEVYLRGAFERADEKILDPDVLWSECDDFDPVIPINLAEIFG